MKKLMLGLFVLILSSFVFLLGFDTKKNIEPNYYYQVYLDDQVIGVIKSKKELENYIDEEGSEIKKKYGVDKVYAPNGLEIRRVITYSGKLDDCKDIFEKISKLRSFTIEGYRYTIKSQETNEDGETINSSTVIYTVSEEVFDESIQKVVETFVGKDNLNAYLSDTQNEIIDTGSYYSDIYIDNDITRKKVKISLDEDIFTDVKSLSRYLLFSTLESGDEYIVQDGDTIESVSNKNKISVDEFLISNPEFTSKDNMLYTGQVVSVEYADPIVDVIANITRVEDQTSYYKVEERNTDTLIQGYEQVVTQGENGLDRVTQIIVYKNGFVDKATEIKKVELKPATNKVVLVGTRYVSGVGGRYWTWPTVSYMVSSGFGYRSGALHVGLDIVTYMGAPIYAANNGVVTMKTSSYGTYGLFIAINHNNGYGTAYAHMGSFAPGITVGSVVERGQVIGYNGMSGYTTGPHLHFEAYYGGTHPGYTYSAYFNPYALY